MEENNHTIKLLRETSHFDYLEDHSKIVKVEVPPFPASFVCPKSPMDWQVAKTIHESELGQITSAHNSDPKKLKETIKCIVYMPVVATFTNNGDDLCWITEIESNPKRMMDLYHRRHDKK